MEDEKVHTLEATGEDEGTRLDVFCVSRFEDLSRSRIQALNAAGFITVCGTRRPDHYKVKAGDVVRVTVVAPEEHDAPTGEDIPVAVVYEDEHAVVVNKPAGMVVHPAHGNWEGTLVNALIGRGTRLSAHGGRFRPGIVHRLDEDASGLMVAAKSDPAYQELVKLLKAREVRRTYHAIVWGNLGARHVTIDRPVGRHPADRQKMSVRSRGGRHAPTEAFVMDSFAHFDYIRVVLGTGRTHQIRVHLAHISHPVLGDALYGGTRKRAHVENNRVKVMIDKVLGKMRRQALHASVLSFTHPVSGRELTFRAALPADMREVLEILYSEDKIQGG